MEIRVLRSFLEIAREGNMTRAAERLADTGSESELCFRPLDPLLKTKMYLIWKKCQMFTPIAELLLEMMKAELLP